MYKATYIKQDKSEQECRDILELSKKYISLLPDKSEWYALYETDFSMLVYEKLISVINTRFFSELLTVGNDEVIRNRIDNASFISMNPHYSDFHFGGDYSTCGIMESGEELLYFSEMGQHGISIAEYDKLFSFFEETSACLSSYIVEDEHIEKDIIEDERALFQFFFPEVLEKDYDFPVYGHEYISAMVEAAYEETDSVFYIHSSSKLKKFKNWVEEDVSRKEYPECADLLYFMEEYKNPMVDFNYNDIVYFIESKENIYLCYHYGYDYYSGIYADGKFFYPSHFFVMVAIEQLLQLIEKIYY